MADFPLLMTVKQLVKAVGGTCLCDYSIIHGFSSVSTDSRAVLPGSLFVPLMGEFQDGHTYIPSALERGASVIFIDSTHANEETPFFTSLAKDHNACIIIVENTLHALQDAARIYVSFFPDLLKIGITGSSGKTTTKEIIGSIFSQKYQVVMNDGNLNSETGLPLSVFKIRGEHEVGIFELGMNRRGEIAEIARVLSPSLAVITNIGTAHIGILGTQAAIAEEKKSIFSFFNSSCAGFIPEDDSWREYLSDISEGTIFPYGLTETVGFEGSVDLGIDGTLIKYEQTEMKFPLPGPYNLKNALAAITLARFTGMTPSEIKNGIEAVKPLFGRAEVIRGPVTIFQDCYNANPDSMESALDFCSNLEWAGKKIFVLASMLELGDESKAAHQKICQLASTAHVDTIFLFGDEMVEAGRAIQWGSVQIEFFTDIDSLSLALSTTVKIGDLVFLKGSRGMALERVRSSLPGCGNKDTSHG